ncbi:hypothetical protein ACTND8_07315 [Atopobiaceae bacterium HCP3S3_F7]
MPKRMVFASPVSWHLSASRIARRIACELSEAGRIVSSLANFSAAPKTSVCLTATASM